MFVCMAYAYCVTQEVLCIAHKYCVLRRNYIVLQHKDFCITHEIVYELELTQSFYGQVQGLIRDNNTSTLWMYSKNSLYQILLEQEDRNVWKLYLQQAKAGDGKGKLIEKRIKKRILCSNSS